MQKKSKARLISERRRAIHAEIQDMETRLAALKLELAELDSAEQVLARLAIWAGESDDENERGGLSQLQAKIAETVAAPSATFARNERPKKLRELAEQVLEDNSINGTTTQELLEIIRTRWKPDVDPNHLRPLAWRMVKEGRWSKDEEGRLRMQQHSSATAGLQEST